MSKVFYDNYITLTRVENHIKNATYTQDEREELWNIVDEIVHHKVLDVILSQLHIDHHPDFLEMFHNSPHDETIIDFFNEKTGNNFEIFIQKESKNIEEEIIKFLLEE